MVYRNGPLFTKCCPDPVKNNVIVCQIKMITLYLESSRFSKIKNIPIIYIAMHK